VNSRHKEAAQAERMPEAEADKIHKKAGNVTKGG
jgi:hypothetical protein